jgi:hypothetical protein
MPSIDILSCNIACDPHMHLYLLVPSSVDRFFLLHRRNSGQVFDNGVASETIRVLDLKSGSKNISKITSDILEHASLDPPESACSDAAINFLPLLYLLSVYLSTISNTRYQVPTRTWRLNNRNITVTPSARALRSAKTLEAL